jgi:hypothetical protein
MINKESVGSNIIIKNYTNEKRKKKKIKYRIK